MTIEQLKVLASLMRGDNESIAFKGAKMVLVEGLTIADTARELGVKPQAVSNGVSRYRKAHEDIKKAY